MEKNNPHLYKCGASSLAHTHLNVTEAAAFLGVHPNTLRKWDAQGYLVPFRTGPRRDRRYSQEQLERFAGLPISGGWARVLTTPV